MKQRATGLLLIVSVAFVVVAITAEDTGAMGYVRAALEAGMVGGLADWFAVTALFRHPLGIPIPHTAVIKARKDQFGATLGEFVQENFLSADTIGERVRASGAVRRVADWLAEPANARNVAAHAADLLVAGADLVREDDVNRAVEAQIRAFVERVPLAPLAGRVLRYATAEGRHQELFDAILRNGQRYLEDNRESLRYRFAQQSPWWLPNAVEDRIFDRLLDGFVALLQSVNVNPDHEFRVYFDARVTEFADRLEHDPELRARGEQLKQELLAHPQLRVWSTSLWSEIKANVRAHASDPESALRAQIAGALADFGVRLRDDPALQARGEELLDRVVRRLVVQFQGDLAALVSGTIQRWDADETSDRLELLLGRDLQFIRINGTVVGGIAGVGIHAVGQLL
jgi:uncharacterized membrane-anchored protein YjiN (DUF445 family)